MDMTDQGQDKFTEDLRSLDNLRWTDVRLCFNSAERLTEQPFIESVGGLALTPRLCFKPGSINLIYLLLSV